MWITIKYKTETYLLLYKAVCLYRNALIKCKTRTGNPNKHK